LISMGALKRQRRPIGPPPLNRQLRNRSVELSRQVARHLKADFLLGDFRLVPFLHGASSAEIPYECQA
jgi:hypothetical protein